MKKLFILNADDLGMSKTKNKAILDACQKGFLRSASLCVNGDEYEDAVVNVVKKCPELGVGIHLNIIEGRALIPKSSLTDASGNFKPGFIRLLARSRNRKFLEDVENEFRAQIEKGRKDVNFDHMDSHVHTHGIPGIFSITARLAAEYGIKAVRTQYEKPYRIPRAKKNITLSFFVNRIKIILLNTFTGINKKRIKNFTTNNYLIGVGYTAMMDSQAVEYGLGKLAKIEKSIVVETLFHPDANNQNNEYQIPFDFKLLDKIKKMGFEPANYSGPVK